MELIRSLSSLNKGDASMAGGKGASLGEMFQANIPVPDGFVILTNSFEYFLAETDIGVEIDAILKTVNKDEMRSVEHASEKIQSLIIRAEIPNNIKTIILDFYKNLDTEYVAVRSSATAEDSSSAAWAGQLESFLNTTEKDLLDKVKYCWASLFTPRAIFYRFEKELHATNISVAVVVQKMVDSEISGVAFSVHPVTEDRNQIIIEAGLGLGEAIVSGSITPDSYVIKKDTREIIDVNISKQNKALYRADSGGNEWINLPETQGSTQILSENQIQELSKIIIAIENHYGFPCDIEWAFENGKFYIVQSRPITTLDTNKKIEEFLLNNTISTRNFDISQYLRLFRLQGVRFFINDMYAKVYPGYGFIILIKDGDYISFMRHSGIEKAHTDGCKLLLDKNGEFQEYQKNITLHWRQVSEFSQIVQNLEQVTLEQVNTYIDLCQKSLELYKYTEFIFTERAFELSEQENNKILKDNVIKMGDIKNESRVFMNLLFLGDECVTHKILSMVSNQYNIPIIDLLEYGEIELKEVFVGYRVSQNIINERRLGSIIENKNGELGYLWGAQAVEIFDQFISNNEKLVDVVKGVVANRGKVQGRVYVLSSGYDNFTTLSQYINEMENGDVLVSETTSPDLMLACKKASAIVTNQGGMMSHAAIVSRELNIPCIVGTKDATQILKTGYMVEVDADKGVVSILDKTRPDLNNYIRLFAFDGSIPFLFSYQFTEVADWLNYLAFGNENSWISYMDKNSVKRASKEGLELYSSVENYNKFSNGLYKTNESLRELTTKIEQDQKISQSQLEEFFKLLAEYRWHYTRTEFFFTDLAFEKRNDFPEINKNFETFEKLKLDGRQYLNEIFLVPNACLFRVLNILGNQFSLTVSQLNNYSPAEMKELFVGKKVSNKLIEDRVTHVHYMKEGRLISLGGSNAMSLIEHLKRNSDIGSRICGKTAYGGKVTARARVITIDIKDYDKVHEFVDAMQEGEVLVAETTEPSIILACKKASAIVTNQGGMMSHAAITAREMKIPCIVGTSVATEKIKTGDLVEVDADNGIINIIEKDK